MSSIAEIKSVVTEALEQHIGHPEDGEEHASKKLEQRAARQIQTELDRQFGGNWNVILGKKVSVAASVGQNEGYAMFNVKDYCVFVFQYNAK